ncbi:MAG: glycosyltransferase family 4 protein [Gemmatimonadales bacterium]|jgi:glycosyltransferase involved in cell wall biosynthesis
MVAACPFPYGRGTPIRIHRLAEALSRRGHEIHVVTYHIGDPEVPEGVAVHRIRDLRWYRHYEPGPTRAKLLILDPLLVRKLRQVLRSHDIDLIHAHHYEGLLVAGLSGAAHCPVIYDAHTTLESELHYYPLGLPKRLCRSLGRMLDRRLPRRASHVIAVSEEIRNTLLELAQLPEDRIDVIPNGVESTLFDVIEPDRRQTEDDRIVAFAGNLAPHQGIEHLLAAFGRVRERWSRARLHIVSSSDFSPYAGLARELGIEDAIELKQVSFGELPRRLAAADVLVNPRVEATGLPMKLLNYMAAGRPIVSFVGSAVHLEDGKTALTAEDGNSDALADAMLRLLEDDDLAARLSREAKRKAREEFDWMIRAAQVEAVYDRVMARRSLGTERSS